uniref:Reverse transcriptase domain-containing protein n=1 Tax=Myripristis murdjan TaxID=586833 RepID=A0A667WJC6_9TELE
MSNRQGGFLAPSHHCRRNNLVDVSSISPIHPTSSTLFCLLNVRSLRNKSFICQDFILSNNIDFFIITESWLCPDEYAPLIETCPPDYLFFHQPRPSGRGGGVACINKNAFKCSPVSFGCFTSFEILSFIIRNNLPFLCVLIYRPPKLISGFIQDFSELLSVIMLKYDRVLILGDFNIHVCCPSSSPFAVDFIKLLDSFNLTQHVNFPSHSKGHTLDLVISSGLNLGEINQIDFPVSDHNALQFQIPFLFPDSKPTSLFHSRPLNLQSAPVFCQAFTKYRESVNNTSHTVDELVSVFNSSCTYILDSIAPVRLRRSRAASLPWITEEVRNTKRQCRRAERKWKKDRNCTSLATLKDLMFCYQLKIKEARNCYFSNLIRTHDHNPRILFKTVNSIIGPPPNQPVEPTAEKCERFLNHFISKINNIRQNFHSISRQPDSDSCPPSTLTQFSQISLSTLEHTVTGSKSSTCLSDCIPTWFLKAVLPTVGRDIVNIINCSLSSGIFPSHFKHAVVSPLLKKPSLDPAVFSNFRPISKLPFLSKILEKTVASQLISFMNENQVFEKFQSGFRRLHSTETALVKVANDLLLAADSGFYSVLILLDLSAAFDTVDHSVLINRLKHSVRVSGVALDWFTFYLSNRSFSVSLGDASSPCAPLSCGVPQGSILGPLLFTIYMLPLGHILRRHNINFHCYADDTQLYVPLKPGSTDASSILSCLSEVKTWMYNNFLQLNDSKSEMIIITPSGPSTSSVHDISSSLRVFSDNLCTEARNLGFLFDSNLSCDAQVTKVVQTCFATLRQLSKIRPFLSPALLEIIIHALISSRLDYCNALYSGISQHNIHRLQLIQNAAARLLTHTRRSDHITPVLAVLHWLPVSFRIDFKVLLLVFKALNGLAPPYIQDLLTPYEPGRSLRSSGRALLEVPYSRLVSRGDRAFAVRGPRLWNALLEGLRQHFVTVCFEKCYTNKVIIIINLILVSAEYPAQPYEILT